MPLIPAIPSKTLSIESKDYQVYEMVNLDPISRPSIVYQRVYVCLYGKRKLKSIRTFSKIRDIYKRIETVHFHIEDIVNELNSWVEQNYRGDHLKYSDLKERYSFQNVLTNGHQYKQLNYTHYTLPGVKISRVSKHMGHIGKVSQAVLDAAAKEAIEHQRSMNTRYNELLAAKHMEFRAIVEQQIAWRSTIV